MQNSIFCSILVLGVLSQITTASPLHSRREAGSFEPSVRESLAARDDGGEIEWPFPKNSSSWTKETPPKSEDKPPNASTDNGDKVHTRKEISRAFINKSCLDDPERGLKDKILAAWDDARVLVDAQTKHRSGYRYDIPHRQWLGKDWNSWGWFTPDFSARIKENFGRLGETFSNNAPRNDYIYFECHDPHKGCEKTDTSAVVAYQYSSPGLLWINHYINFCDPWETFPTLDEALQSVKNNKYGQKVMENFELTRTGALFHEVWHMENLVSKPRTKDYAYQAQNNWNLAKDKGTWWATENADSYHMDALAIYVQQHFSSSMGPVPYKELEAMDAEAFRNTKKPTSHNYTFSVLPNTNTEPIDHPKIADKKYWEEITFDVWPETEKPEEEEPSPAKKTKTLAIATDTMTDVKLPADGDLKLGKLHWLYVQADYGKGAQCRTDTVYDEWMDLESGVTKNYYPAGTKKMKLFGEDCEYLNNGHTAGKLVCGNKDIECIHDPADEDNDDLEANKGLYKCGDNTTRQPVFVCSW